MKNLINPMLAVLLISVASCTKGTLANTCNRKYGIK